MFHGLGRRARREPFGCEGMRAARTGALGCVGPGVPHDGVDTVFVK